ncbi:MULTISPECIES: DNA polymerase IV [unclassified Arcicella]|uniref:DNA polymerase IV n=1 Tax=unclassified Arcicella TaxID=2644986 RepID=UPI0028567A67|nr:MULTISPECIES: DNA polymerase IV [unclassified Arcicella]MDR6564595.1 DNA polymerase-4 [Arcicella sp. BE51]MDR6814477.1 DNA polymerase-4 [Arcicella sp. BE140]MDR6825767.1 DNA polymerase-4 [Arcicella sp. BE139]
MPETNIRKIIHIDMDAFYASVEQRDNPALRGKPVAVGGSRERGVVAAASYEARKFGVRSAMSSMMAARKCPNLIFVKPRFESYKTVSKQIREIFAEYTHLIEPLSLDEAYLDVTENLKGIDSATEIAIEIRAKIKEKTQLTASAGVSYNKFLAKLASDYKKPDGLFVIKPKQGEKFVEQLEVYRFHGIGRVTADKMNKMNIFTGLDLRQYDEAFLTKHFGKAGKYYYNIARAIDNRPVNPERIRKSVGSENTFWRDLETNVELEAGLKPIIDDVWKYCDRTHVYGRTVNLKVKFNDFQIITRSRTTLSPIFDSAFFEKIAFELLEQLYPIPKGVRLLGISLSNLASADEMVGKQLTLEF